MSPRHEVRWRPIGFVGGSSALTEGFVRFPPLPLVDEAGEAVDRSDGEVDLALTSLSP
jgi:hypothetical protein